MKKINYASLNPRQKETYNFQKVSAILADYGFATIKLNDDWNGADFIAQHIDGETYLKVQLKGRLTFNKKYQKKGLHIAFPYDGDWYLYDHDELLNTFLGEYENQMAVSKSWIEKGDYNWGSLSEKIKKELESSKLDFK
ncbi:hypothetical protein LCGC14_1923670 [marine sediment metagenome]|uniref:PD(D/E)XK endonuclease domain-containing protein n=1 Tax=marine sediment metagenome TaxID=412755 RepID=A0A0F9IMT9_9ZZZZ